MRLNTKHFGEVDYDEDSVIIFEEGLPGFKNDTQFLLISENPGDLFQWLQSTEDEELAFVLVDIRQILPEYQPIVEPGILASLEDGNELFYYNIAVVPEDIHQMRVNLKAPIIINKSAQKGKQVIAGNEEYGVRHYIFKDLDNKKVIGC